jgi:hypothetical protein
MLASLLGVSSIAQCEWYIPQDVSAATTPMVLVCSGDIPPANYFLADQICAQASFDTDPFCVNSDWDSVCLNDYNFCLSGNVDCGSGSWYIPTTLNGSPMEWDCNAPAGFILADQDCAQETVNNDSYCVDTSWDSLCLDAYDACLAGGCAELGCTDPGACNFSPTADCEDGSCVAAGCIDPAACNFDPAAGCDDGSCILPLYYIPTDFSASPVEPMVLVCAGGEPANYILADQVCAQERVDNDPFCITNDWDALCHNAYNCCAGNALGCTDTFACNFDPNACPDLALCTYSGCTDPIACNFDPAAGCDDGSCILPLYYIPTDFSASTSEPMVLVCAGGEPANYILADQFCAQARVDNDPFCITNDWDAVCINAYNCCAGNALGCTDTFACNFDPNACLDLALCTYSGCTDPMACNFDPAAGCDDGSCILPLYYIPTDFSASTSEPMVLVCAGSEPANYILADQFCAQARVDNDPFCITNDWDAVCINAYNCCAGNALGCTDTFACNFDPNACLDLALCTYSGCTDPMACNFDPAAGCDDGSCLAAGCINPAACNFDPAAGCDDGSCLAAGCINPAACNFDPAAGCDDGSCILPLYYIPTDFSASPVEPMVLVCAGGEPANYILADQFCAQAQVDNDPFCINNDWDVVCIDAYNCCAGNALGCTDTFACNFDPNACPDVALCTYSGCTDPIACNFDATAGCDDGSCTFQDNPVVDMTVNTWTLAFDFGCTGFPTEVDMFFSGDQSWNIPVYAETGTWSLCTDFYMHNYDGGVETIYQASWDGTQFNGTISGNVTGCFTLLPQIPGCIDIAACNYDSAATVDDGSCLAAGCIDPAACNFDPAAGCDDGSCLAAGCIDPAACNFDPAAGCDDGSCVFGPSNDVCSGAIALSTNTTVTADNTNSCLNGANPDCGGSLQIEDVWFTYTSIGGGAITFFTELNGSLGDTRAAVYDACGGAQILCNDDFFSLASRLDFPSVAGTTYYFQAGGFQGQTGSFDVTVFECGIGCVDSSACNYDPTATISSGDCVFGGCTFANACNYDANASCDDGSCIYSGCTDPTADNYDVIAGCDDGSCYFLGCTYLEADNYDAAATMDNGACLFTLGSNCPADLNADGLINASDLLEFLGSFGAVCP